MVQLHDFLRLLSFNGRNDLARVVVIGVALHDLLLVLLISNGPMGGRVVDVATSKQVGREIKTPIVLGCWHQVVKVYLLQVLQMRSVS